MTSFFVGNEHHLMVYQKNTGLMFWADDLLICQRHARGLKAQPFLEADRKAGFGKRGCPFCVGGELEGRFSLYRSQRQIKAALNGLP